MADAHPPKRQPHDLICGAPRDVTLRGCLSDDRSVPVSSSSPPPAATRWAIFAPLCAFAIRFRWAIVAAWIAAVVGGLRTLPSLSSVAKANDAQFLSSSSPSVRAGKLAGGTSEAQQLGFSIAFGVLLDTFLVRTLLVPSIAALLGRWNWWPSGRGLPDHPSVSRTLSEQPMRGR